MFVGLLALTSCDDDNDSNPTLQQPTSFVLNQPGLSGNIYDLSKSSAIVLTAKQPDYGYTAPVAYGLQMSLNNNWTEGNYYSLEATTTSPKYSVDPVDLDKGIMTLTGITDAASMAPDSAYKIYVRMRAALPSDSTTEVYSNAVALNVMPYFIQLKVAAPDFWYLVGGCIGDGSWTSNSSINAYLSLFPLSLVKDYTYNAKSGAGEFTFTGYFADTDIFKLKHVSDKWDEQWGTKDGAFVKNDGGSGNITVPTSGYYTLTLNTLTDKVTLEKADVTPTVYSKVSIIGLNGDWTNDIDMSPAKNATNNHMWTTTITVKATTQFKFRANASWDVNWGYGTNDGDVNLYGWGVGGGKNIGIEPGTYVVYFNDVDGYFRLIRYSD